MKRTCPSFFHYLFFNEIDEGEMTLYPFLKLAVAKTYIKAAFFLKYFTKVVSISVIPRASLFCLQNVKTNRQLTTSV